MELMDQSIQNGFDTWRGFLKEDPPIEYTDYELRGLREEK